MGRCVVPHYAGGARSCPDARRSASGRRHGTLRPWAESLPYASAKRSMTSATALSSQVASTQASCSFMPMPRERSRTFARCHAESAA